MRSHFLRAASPKGVVNALVLEIVLPAPQTFALGVKSPLNVDIDWGDGSEDFGVTAEYPSHVYASSGTYLVSIKNNATIRIRSAETAVESRSKITRVVNGGGLGFGWNSNLEAMFFGCTSLTETDLIDLSSISNIENMFDGCQLTELPVFDMSTVDYAFRFARGQQFTEVPAGISFTDLDEVRSLFENNANLTTIHRGLFVGINASAFGGENGWLAGCALTAQSIENLMLDLDALPGTGGQCSVAGGTNAGLSTWTTAAVNARNSLISKGWTINQNA